MTAEPRGGPTAILFILYALAGAALYKASRGGGELGKSAYFIAFPFHAIGLPVLAVLGTGAQEMLGSNGFWAASLLGVGAAIMAAGGDPCTATFGAVVFVGLARLFLAGINDLIAG
jgi:hypothetical protein